MGTGLVAGLRRVRHRVAMARRRKYFCIGRNKTGTTSLELLFRELGFAVGDQLAAERIAYRDHFTAGPQPRLRDPMDPAALIAYCRDAEFFQDAPFSWPGVYRALDAAFPGSGFILTVRDDADQWYRSMVRFYTKLYGTDGAPPTADQLRASTRVGPGFAYRNTVLLHGTTDARPFDPELMKAHYERHNADVRAWFADRPDDLIEINVSRPDDLPRLLAFVGRTSARDGFPWENRT